MINEDPTSPQVVEALLPLGAGVHSTTLLPTITTIVTSAFTIFISRTITTMIFKGLLLQLLLETSRTITTIIVKDYYYRYCY